jgi:hypothetical protein
MRVPGSGSYQTRAKVKSLAGDVRPADDEQLRRWPYYVEVKNLRAMDILEALHRRPPAKDKTHTLLGIWRQTKECAKQAGKEPVLFFKTTRSPWFVMIGVDTGKGRLLSTRLAMTTATGERVLLFYPKAFLWRGANGTGKEESCTASKKGGRQED